MVQMLDEVIQALYDKFENACDEQKRAEEAVSENHKDLNLWKQFVLRNFDKEEARMKLWKAIHEKHGLWNCNMGIRDNYSLVMLPPPKHPMDDLMRIIKGL